MSDLMLYDSQTAFQGGMQSGVDPSLVADHQYARGINIACREGVLDVRPSFDKKNLDTASLALSAKEYSEAETAYEEAIDAVEAQQIIVDVAEDDYNDAGVSTALAVATAKANPIISDIQIFYDLTLDGTNFLDFQHMVGSHNGLLTGIMDRAVTSPITYPIGYPFYGVTHETPVYVPNPDCPYTDAELFNNFQFEIEKAYFDWGGASSTYTNYTKPFLANVTMVTATPEDEILLGHSIASLELLDAIENSDGEADDEYATWQAELVILSGLEADVAFKLSIFESLIDFLPTYNNGKFQGAEIYKNGERNYIVEVINGHIFMINLNDNKITTVSTPSTALNPRVDRCYFVQAENYMIIQDGISQPKILEGATVRDADTSIPEIPRGTNMAYGHGRIAIQVSPRHFVMSDIYLAYEPDNVLKMKEFGFLNEGGGFTVSGRLGNIIGLELAKVADTSTGDGPLIAVCENGFASYSINNPRIQWNGIDIAKIQLFGTGLVGKDALCHIGEDILYRSYDGIRSYQVGQREAAQGYKYTELSKEVESYIQNDMQYNGKFISMTFFDKRMLSLTAPKGMKARTSGYVSVEEDYDEAKTAALLVDEDITDENARSTYEAQLDLIFTTATTWTAKQSFVDETEAKWLIQYNLPDTHLLPEDEPIAQDIIDAQVASISTDPAPDDKYCRIQNLISWATSDLVGTEISDYEALWLYYTSYLKKVDSYVDDTYFKGLIAFDFSLAGYTKSTQDSQYNRVNTGSYDGIWTGIHATSLLTTIIGGVKKCFVTAKDNDGKNIIYEITRRQDGFDNIRQKAIECILDTKSMPYKAEQTYVPAPFVYKKLEDLTLWVTGISGDVNIEIQTSPDVLDSFFKIGELQLKATTETSGDPRLIGAPQSRAMIPLWDLPNETDLTTKKKVRLGNEFMFRMIWSGKVRIRRFFTAARKIEQDKQENKETDSTTYPIDEFNQYRYSSE